MNYKTLILVILIMFKGIYVCSQSNDNNWMPIPKSWETGNKNFTLTKTFTVGIEGPSIERLEKYSSRFLRRLDWRTGLFFSQKDVLTVSSGTESSLNIKIKRKGLLKLGEDESYQLEISEDGLYLTAETDMGAMRGLETLLQLLKNNNGSYVFNEITVQDAPRFPWRGLMIDVSRHFQPIDVIKRNIDGMAAVKMNVLHLHLVDDHGFRIESKVHPRLHTLASDGQYFTQTEMKEIVRFAGDRGIRVVPEFDVPGHASAFLTAFPELASAPGPYKLQNRSGIFDPTLNPTIDKTYEVLNSLFSEMSAIFPDEYFHIGGDENEGKHWDANTGIQNFMSKNGFKNNHQLQNYFNIRIQKHLSSLGKKMMGWDEIMQDGLPKDAIIHSWRGLKSLKEASQKGYKCLLSNGFYIDLMKKASDHYDTDPLPTGLGLTTIEEANILGGEATMWGELVTPYLIDSRIWPRTAAIAERLWSPSEHRNTKDMYRRLEIMNQQLEEHGLTHIKNRSVMMRNIVKGYNIEPLRILADVAEPLEGYSRNPAGEIYEFHYAFNRFADITLADAVDARTFKNLVKSYQSDRDPNKKKEIKKWLTIWKDNHIAISQLIETSPALKEVESISESLSKIAQVGLEALDTKNSTLTLAEKIKSYTASMKVLDDAIKQGARTELQVIESIKMLVKTELAVIQASKNTTKIKVDGDLKDWTNANWDYFVPSQWRNWSDTCYYAIQWDEKKLYFAFKVTNDNLQASKKFRDEMGLHTDDGIEILIDADNDKSTEWKDDDFAYHVNVLNAIMDDRGLNKSGEYDNSWNGKAKTNVSIMGSVNNSLDMDKGYHVELSIDWKEVGKKPKPGLKMGVNLCVNDTDNLRNEYRYYDYMSLSVFHFPIGFADLVLTE